MSPLGSTLAVAWHLPSWVEVRWHSRHCTLVVVEEHGGDHRPWAVGALDHKLQVVELHRVEERHHSSWVVEPWVVEHRMAAVVDKLLAVVGNLAVVVDIHPLVVDMGSFNVCVECGNKLGCCSLSCCCRVFFLSRCDLGDDDGVCASVVSHNKREGKVLRVQRSDSLSV